MMIVLNIIIANTLIFLNNIISFLFSLAQLKQPVVCAMTNYFQLNLF